MTPKFSAGKNIAMKVPAHEYDQTVRFYRDILGFKEILGGSVGQADSVRFEFGDKILWLDRVAQLSQAEIWLEVTSDDAKAAAEHLDHMGCVRRDEIEALPGTSNAFWVSSPANIIHLISPTDS